eukprot:GHVP01021532.1.p1 GENE.GHVP01021532.1~~GHVP01021532.1.p1  ORF type:complete len:508 (-),score=65.66 GHVP01021532.1:221-1744(-)
MTYKEDSFFYVKFISRIFRTGISNGAISYLLFIWCGILMYLLYGITGRTIMPCLTDISTTLNLTPETTGMIVLSFGNNIADIITAFFAARDHPEMEIGQALGTGVFMMSCMLGTLIVLGLRNLPEPKDKKDMKTIKLPKDSTQKNIIGITGCLIFMCGSILYGKMNIYIGILSPVLYFLYLFWVLKSTKKKKEPDEEEKEKKQEIRKIYYFLGNWELPSGSNKQSIFQCFLSALEPLFFFSIFPWDDGQEENDTENEKVKKGRRIEEKYKNISRALSPLIFNTIVIYFGIFRAGRSVSESKGIFIGSYFGGLVLFWGILLYVYKRPKNPRKRWIILFPVLLFGMGFVYLLLEEFILCLGFLGEILNIPDSYIGLTLLCMGSVICDFLSNILYIRNEKDGFKTTFVASFGGQIQAIMVPMGIGFLIVCIKTKGHTIDISPVGVEIWFTVVYLLFLIVIFTIFCIISNYRFGLFHGVVLILLYPVYITSIIVYGVKTNQNPVISSLNIY